MGFQRTLNLFPEFDRLCMFCLLLPWLTMTSKSIIFIITTIASITAYVEA